MNVELQYGKPRSRLTVSTVQCGPALLARHGQREPWRILAVGDPDRATVVSRMIANTCRHAPNKSLVSYTSNVP